MKYIHEETVHNLKDPEIIIPKILDYNTPVTLQADVVLMHLITDGKLNAFALKKPLFKQSSDLESSIGARASWD